MSEAERIEMPEEMQGDDAPQETGISAEAAQLDIGMSLNAKAAPENDGPTEESETPPEEDTAEQPAHALSGATLEAMSRTDPLALAQAEAERTKWNRRKSAARERVYRWCKLYMADGGFKLSISLVTAIIAASIIVIAGIFSDRQLSVVFWRAIIGFFVSGLFMGGVLYWLDSIGIPLFISRHEEQIQMEWINEAEEPEAGEGEQAEGEAEETEQEDLEELLTQEGEEAPQEGAEASPEGEENPEAEGEETASEETVLTGEEGQPAPSEPLEEEQPSDEGALPEEENAAETSEGDMGDMGGLENAVLDDAFASGETEEEPEEPPTFAPMTSENLESLSVPES